MAPVIAADKKHSAQAAKHPKHLLARSLAAVLGVVLAVPLLTPAALAQIAPVGGDHYAARESDTGFAGAVNAGGGYGTSVPLNLPGARGGLKVPVHVVYGGRRFGAAGLGWDVPLSFIRRDVRLAHRRPANIPDASPQPREQLTLTLDSGSTALVRKADDTAWVARRNDAQLEVHDVGGGVLEMYDGNGLRYSFSSTPIGSSQPLDNGNLYLLQDIFGAAGTQVHLAYTIGTPSLAGGVTGLSIDLASVSYNFNSFATGVCAKHQVNLVYEADASSPLSLSMLGSTPLVRMHKLHAVDVTAREAATDQPQPCSGVMRSLLTYNFDYQNDADTGQFQLRRVTMIGQETTTERTLTLPVATYTYGQATDSNGSTLTYRFRQQIAAASLPANVDTSFALASTNNQTASDGSTLSRSYQNLMDINGDGRPDLLYLTDIGVSGGLTAALNKPDPANPKNALFTPISVPTSGPGYIFESSQISPQPRQTDVNGSGNASLRWVQMIDMNADGRVDIVVANQVSNFWVVYLNKPDPQDPNRVVWVQRNIDIRPLLPYLPSTPGAVVQNSDGVFLALSSTASGHDQGFNTCWHKQGLNWFKAPTAFGKDPGCPLPAGGPVDLTDRTITQWQLSDINGDGYPDLVFNTAAVGQIINVADPTPSSDEGVDGDFLVLQTVKPFDFTVPNQVKALLNVAGVHLASSGDERAFSAPITLDADTAGCGVSRWVSTVGAGGRSSSFQECGFADINGDGLVDRVNRTFVGLGQVARLGTGDSTAPFSDATIPLPGPLSYSQSTLDSIDFFGHYRPHACPTQPPSNQSQFPVPSSTYPIQQTNGFSDLNGDGIPDYVALGSTGWTVAFGTGTGFAAPKSIVSTGGQFELSLEKVGCFPINSSGGTGAGLFDFYGEGQPAFVTLSGNAINIYSLSAAGVTGLPAGLLTRIDNGYGGSTFITYRSAKEDTTTNHLVPSPEVVVTSVQDSSGLSLAPTLYAYGNASQYFDSAADRWVSPGYRRKVSLRNTGDVNMPNAGNAVISDALPLDPFNLSVSVDTTTRLLRYLKVGRTSDVTTISDGTLGTDPWALLGTDVTTDVRRTAATHTAYSSTTSQLLPAGKTGNEYCVDMLDPYDFTGSLNYKNSHDSFDQCAERGFALQTSVNSYLGAPTTAVGTADVIVTPSIVQTASSVTAFDNLGRVTDTTSTGDLADPSTKLCTHVDYAAPQTSPVHVLNAVAQQTVTACGANAPTLSKKRFEYDGLKAAQAGQVTNGFLTSITVTRYDGDTHASLGDIRLFDAAYDDSGNGTLRGIIKFRDDGAVSQVQYNYDAFGLVVTSTNSTATDPIGGALQTLSTSSTFDPVTLNMTSTTDANSTVGGTTYDGFGRMTRLKVTPPGGTEGVLASTSYSGFELIDTNGDGIPDAPDGSLGGRSIVQKVFQDAVPEVNVATAPGRITTTYLDSLGRVGTTKTDLGANYPNKVRIDRFFDVLGRVNFKSDPYEDTGAEQTLYGTTYTYNPDGSPACFIRGPGVQPFTTNVDETNEVYPTCFNRSFINNQEVRDRSDPDALLPGSSQFNNFNRTFLNATGRVLERSINHNGSGGVTVLKDVTFGYDALGHRTSMARYQDPASKMGKLTTQWHYDSLGWLTKLEQPGVAEQTRTFDSWGNVTVVQWCDDLTEAPCPSADRRTISRYDGRNRLIHREDQNNNSGQPVPGTVADFSYDANSAAGFFPRNNVLGRLASATWATGQEWFTYDAFGRAAQKTFIDTTVTPNPAYYYEVHERHDDGSEKTLHLDLQDTNKQDEQVNYGYDSAGRVNSAVYSFGGSSQNLFGPSGTSPIYDAFGRIKNANYGATTFNQTFASTGRRLLTDRKVTGGNARDISFPTVNGVTAYDPVGRERNRQETFSSSALNVQTLTFLNQYDGLGRLSNQGISGTRLSTPVGWQSNFTYDPLGNVLQESSNASGTVNASLGYAAPDFDRICGLTYGTASTPQGPCNVGYDGVGNTVSMPTGTGSTRTLDYFPNGAVKHIGDGGSNANFTYDAFGALQQLNVDTTSADRRADKNFGSFIKQRIEGAQSVVNRRIPTPGGVIATLHGPMTGKWSFTFGDGHGTRFVTDQTGAYQQGVEYQPFGLASSPSFFPIKPSVGPGTTYYASAQWNGGDLLAAFGVVNLGARVYDPVIGRFLSRDPILQARNPYAFAGNDPINKSDPTGMFQECIFCDAGGAGDAPGGGGNTSPGGVLQNLGASGAGDPFGDRGFTQNGGTSASGMGGSGNAASGVGGSGNAALDAARSLFLSSYCGGSGGVCDFGPDEGVANFLFQLMGYLWPIEVVDPLPTREAAVDLSMPSTGGGPWAGRENTTGLQQVLDACNCMTPKAFKNWLIERRLISPVETKMIDFNTPPDPRVSQDKNDRRQGYRDPDATQGEYDAEYQTHEALRDTGAKYVGETTIYPWSGNPARTAPRADSFRNPAYIITPDPFGGKDIKTDLSPRTSTWFFQNPLGTGGQVNPLLMLSE